MSDVSGLLDPDQAQALWDWAWSELDDGSLRHPWLGRGQVAEGLLDILTYLAHEFALTGRSEWLERLPDLLQCERDWLMRDSSAKERCMTAVGMLLHEGAPVTKAVRAMAKSTDPHVRAIVASALSLEHPEARAVLEGLARDNNREVRKLARQRLPAGAPRAWWEGSFASDPLPRLAKGGDEIVAGLRTLALFSDRAFSEREAMLAQLLDALPRVPTKLLAEFARHFVTFGDLGPGNGPILAELLRRPEGAVAVWNLIVARLDRPHPWPQLRFVLDELAKSFDAAGTEALCRGFARLLVERRDRAKAGDMTRLAADLLRSLWPAGLPGVLVLDAWIGLADRPELAHELQSCLRSERVDLRPELGRLLPLAEANPKQLLRSLDATVDRLDVEGRRAFIARGLASESEEVRGLALEQLGGLPPEPGQDPDELFRRYWAQPKPRKAIVRDATLAEIFCPQLRRQLRARMLDHKEASAVARTIGRLWGGVAGFEGDADRREHAAAWHGHASEVGPPTEQEWTLWRELGRQVLDDDRDCGAASVSLVRPPGPLEPEDAAMVEHLMERWRSMLAQLREVGSDELRSRAMVETFAMYEVLLGVEAPFVDAMFDEIRVTVQGCDAELAEALERYLDLRRPRD